MPPIIDRRYGVAEGLAVKAPVAVATTANITLAGLQIIDAYQTLAGDRVLVKDQDNAIYNGIWVAAAGNWTRDKDFNGPFDIIVGTRVFVINGTANGLIEYYVTEAGTIGSGDINFDVTFNYVVTTTNLANHSVTNAKFRQSAALSIVGNATNATADVADITAGSDHQVLRRSGTALAFGAVNLAQAAAVTGILAVANGGTGASTLTNHGILLGQGTSAIVAAAAMTNGQLLIGQTGADPAPTTMSGDATLAAAGALTLATVNANVGSFGAAGSSLSLTADAKGRITAVSAQSISITASQVSDFTEAAQDAIGTLFVDSSELDFTYTDGSNTLTASIITNSVAYTKLAQLAGLSVLGNATNGTANVTAITAANDGEILRRSGTSIGFGTIATSGIGDDQVTNAKLANMAQSTIKGRAAGAGAGDPTDLTGTQATAILDALVGDSGAGGTKGLVPAPAAGDAAAAKFLKADGTWQIPSAGGGGGDVLAANNLSEYTATASTARGNISAAKSGANTDITSVLLNQTGLVVKGATAFALTIKPNETLTAGRTLSIVTGDADRSITLGGNATINGGTHSGTNTGDQTITLTGDVTGSGTGSFAATIAAAAVTYAKFQDVAALSVVGRSANTSGVTAAITAASDGQVLRRSGTSIGFGAVDLASANSITGNLPVANLNSGTSASSSTFWRGDGTWAAVATGDFQEFNASGTWTKPSNFAADSYVLIEVWGAGGSGARGASFATNIAAGGGGCYMCVWKKLSALGATETVTIGAGGAATNTTGAGNNGGNTTFGTHITGYGGKAGATGNSQSNGGGTYFSGVYQMTNINGGHLHFGAIGNGSSVGTPDVSQNAIYGGGGGGGVQGVAGGSIGGTSQFGGGGGFSSTASGVAAVAGSQPGGGGGAGCNAFSGAGGDGRCRVTVLNAA